MEINSWVDSTTGYEYHYGCGGQVYNFKEGRICNRCSQEEDHTEGSKAMDTVALPVEDINEHAERLKAEYLENKKVEPTEETTSFGAEFYSIPVEGLPQMVGDYVLMISKERTLRLCKCEWIIHPDDVDKPEGTRRRRRGEPTLDCPIHSKEGFLMGFFTWMFKAEEHAGD